MEQVTGHVMTGHYPHSLPCDEGRGRYHDRLDAAAIQPKLDTTVIQQVELLWGHGVSRWAKVSCRLVKDTAEALPLM